MEIVEFPPHFSKYICDQIFKNCSLIAIKISPQDVELCTILQHTDEQSAVTHIYLEYIFFGVSIQRQFCNGKIITADNVALDLQHRIHLLCIHESLNGIRHTADNHILQKKLPHAVVHSFRDGRFIIFIKIQVHNMFVVFLCEIKDGKSFAALTAAFDKDKKDGKFFQGSFFENSNFFKRLFKTGINFSIFLQH